MAETRRDGGADGDLGKVTWGGDPGRKAVIQEQQARGRKVLAVLPVHYPKALLTAMGIHAVELWGPPGAPRGPDAGRLQTYVCAVARNALAFLAAGHAKMVDGVLFPHTCDSIQGLATLAPDFGGWSGPAFRFLHPKGEERPSSRAFVRAELASLAADLASLTGAPLETHALRAALALHREIDDLKAELLGERVRLDLGDRDLYTVLRRGEYLWPESHLVELQAAARRLRPSTVQTGLPVMITGYVPEPISLFDHLNDAGAYVAADDYAAVGRRIVRLSHDPEIDPMVVLTRQQLEAPPCSTRMASLPRRLDYLAGLYRRNGAAGLIIHVPKFCEPELFDVPAIRRRFTELDVPILYLEGELELELSGQTQVRLEAFCEMVAARRRAS